MKDVDKHKALMVARKGRAPLKPACHHKAAVHVHLLSPKKSCSDLDDKESIDKDEDEAAELGEEE
ncbi:hypothetical protein FRB95_000404 [Tulasnella sp. JGI-2019a]|nr:hypothetical protein FRB95_000404 [Tulasnella sp. JGI-2019a]